MKALLYCTKSKLQLFRDIITGKWLIDKIKNKNAVNGKIVAECDFEVEEIKRINTVGDWFCYENQDEIMEKSKLDVNKFFNYLKGKNGYAIHIKNLKVFDKPKELNFFRKKYKDYYFELNKAPQNMMKICFVDDIGWVLDYILISIRPEWLRKILNGEKEIEVRKIVLKEML